MDYIFFTVLSHSSSLADLLYLFQIASVLINQFETIISRKLFQRTRFVILQLLDSSTILSIVTLRIPLDLFQRYLRTNFHTNYSTLVPKPYTHIFALLITYQRQYWIISHSQASHLHGHVNTSREAVCLINPVLY